jgi:hypothetical protein
LAKEDISSRLEQIDLLGWDGALPAAKFMSALGAPAGDEGVRSLLGKVDLFAVGRKSSYL